jgi:hypothetical protein
VINAGHYTAFIKNEHNSNWYHYDDSSVKDVPESRVRSEYAYILFYRRKDTANGKLEDILPIVNNYSKEGFFRGKPVLLKDQKLGNAYFWEYQEQ